MQLVHLCSSLPDYVLVQVFLLQNSKTAPACPSIRARRRFRSDSYLPPSQSDWVLYDVSKQSKSTSWRRHIQFHYGHRVTCLVIYHSWWESIWQWLEVGSLRRVRETRRVLQQVTVSRQDVVNYTSFTFTMCTKSRYSPWNLLWHTRSGRFKRRPFPIARLPNTSHEKVVNK